MRIVHLFVSYAHVNLCHFFSSSLCQGLAATSACGSSWTFLLTFLRTAPRRSEYLFCFLLLACFHGRVVKHGRNWHVSPLETTFWSVILNSNLAFKTLLYRTDTDYWVCLCLKKHMAGTMSSRLPCCFWGVLRLSQLADLG